ncbi:MAG: ABC transporter permease [Planctomycetaceae bacterium]|nr:ABC transporter permease [Planctomycetaceae bacterium]
MTPPTSWTFLWRLPGQSGLVGVMAAQEMRKRYAGTLGGFAWTVLHPLMLIVIYWLVFSVGLRVPPAGNVPFVIGFLCGMIPWLMFAETLNACTSAIAANAYLVKKTVFPTEILPVVHLAAGMATHVIMLAVLAVLMVVYGVGFSLWNVQFLYYLLAMSVLCIGLGWILSALNVFYRDIGQVLAIAINMWFWLTPIVWPLAMLPGKFQAFVRLNPMIYIVQGYRDSFIEHVPLWQNWQGGAYFWILAAAVFMFGGRLFGRLKGDFAEAI